MSPETPDSSLYHLYTVWFFSPNLLSPTDAYYFKTNDPDNNMSFIRIGLDKSPTSKAIVDSQKFYIQSARISNNLIEMFVGATLVDRQKFTGTVNPIVNSGALGAGYYNHAITDIFIGDIHRVCMFNRVLDYESFFAAINYLKNSLGI